MAASDRSGGRGVSEPRSPVGVVVATRNRRASLLRTLDALAAMSPGVRVVVVDNGSTDGSPDAVADQHTGVRLVTLPHNAGAVARNAGLHLLDTPLVAFADDDSWWAPGSLDRAASVFAGHPRLAVLLARVVLADGTTDAVSRKAAAAPLGRAPDLPGPVVAGWPACGVVVRRGVALAAGGFSPLLGFGGEEELLALDVAALGWGQTSCSAVVAVHAPDPARTPAAAHARWARQQRNTALTAVLRLPVRDAAAAAAVLARAALTDRVAAAALAGLAARLPAALAGRRRVPAAVAVDHRRAGRPLPPA